MDILLLGKLEVIHYLVHLIDGFHTHLTTIINILESDKLKIEILNLFPYQKRGAQTFPNLQRHNSQYLLRQLK